MSCSVSQDLVEAYLNEKRKEVIPVLKKLVEDEGYTFLDFSNTDPASIPSWSFLQRIKEAVAFFGRTQTSAVLPELRPELNDLECGILMKVAPSGVSDKTCLYHPFRVVTADESTKQRIVNWLKGASAWECIVCFEDKESSLKSMTAKNARVSCVCGAILCFGCEIDLILDHNYGDDFNFECPNCREEHYPVGHLQLLYEVLLTTPSLEGMSEAQLSLIKKYADYDGSAKALEGVRRKQQNLYRRVEALTPKLLIAGGWNPKTMTDANYKALGQMTFAEIKKEIEMEQKRKEVECERKTSAARSAHSFSRDACANCGKAFWDKKERQHAPKCQKCSRAFYCNVKCRKAHKKKHSQLCDANGKKKKRVPKKKPKRAKVKAGCAPY